MKKNKFKSLLLTSLITLFPLTSQAEIAPKQWLEDEIIKDEFFLWLGLHAFSFPRYIGSSENEILIRPIIEIDKRIKKQTSLIIDSDAGIGAKLFRYKNTYAGIGGFWRFGWDAEDDLQGLDDRDGSLESSLFVGYNNSEIGFETMLISSWGWFGDVNGFILTAKAEQELRLNYAFRPTLGARISWANSQYMNNYFGISSDEAQRATYISNAYEADAGFRDARIYIDNRFDIHKNIRLYMDGYVGFVLDEAKASPIVSEVGQDINYGAGFGISFRF